MTEEETIRRCKTYVVKDVEARRLREISATTENAEGRMTLVFSFVTAPLLE